jgi:hypothetical protein
MCVCQLLSSLPFADEKGRFSFYILILVCWNWGLQCLCVWPLCQIYILSDFFVGGLIRHMALIIWWFRQGTIILLLHLLRYEMLWNSSMVSFFPELCRYSFVSNRLITVVKVLLSWFSSLVWLTSNGLLQYGESALLPWSSYAVGLKFP